METDIGTRIKILRVKSGLTQGQLANTLGVSASAIGMYEQNKRKPEYKVLVKISKLFEVTTDYLIKGDSDSKEETYDDKLKTLVSEELLVAFEDFNKWSEDDKRELIHYLNAKKLSRK